MRNKRETMTKWQTIVSWAVLRDNRAKQNKATFSFFSKCCRWRRTLWKTNWSLCNCVVIVQFSIHYTSWATSIVEISKINKTTKISLENRNIRCEYYETRQLQRHAQYQIAQFSEDPRFEYPIISSICYSIENFLFH